ncbi:hypothetical protein [Dactylosporangium sp. CA-092794]|uniref:hypothetical protein n=1 Tax=Dactylosporangium sp. CA-092794 TaxID=3239929 RepID=UPI003D8B0F5D
MLKTFPSHAIAGAEGNSPWLWFFDGIDGTAAMIRTALAEALDVEVPQPPRAFGVTIAVLHEAAVRPKAEGHGHARDGPFTELPGLRMIEGATPLTLWDTFQRQGVLFSRQRAARVERHLRSQLPGRAGTWVVVLEPPVRSA